MINSKELINQILDLNNKWENFLEEEKNMVISILNHCMENDIIFSKMGDDEYVYENELYVINIKIKHKNIYDVTVERHDKDLFFSTSYSQVDLTLGEIPLFAEYLHNFKGKNINSFIENVFDEIEDIKEQKNNISDEHYSVLIDLLLHCIKYEFIFKSQKNTDKTISYTYKDDELKIIIDSNRFDKCLTPMFEVQVYIKSANEEKLILNQFIRKHKFAFFAAYLENNAIKEYPNE